MQWPAATYSKAFSNEEIERILAMRDVLPPADSKLVDGTMDIKRRSSTLWWLRNEIPQCKWVMERMANLVASLNAQYFHFSINQLEPMQLGQYDQTTSDHYDRHVDLNWEGKPGWNRKLSVSVQLTDSAAYEGGDLVLYAQDFRPWTVSREKGALIMFRSHIIHEVTPVTKGTRHSLVAWVQGPPWQ